MSLGLYFTIPQLGINLKDAIMAIRSQQCPDKTLFTGVEESTDKQCIQLVHTGNVEAEANAINDGLPLYLAHKLGPRVWSWFSMETRTSLAQCYWDPNEGMKDLVDRVHDTALFESDTHDDMDAFGYDDEREAVVCENLPKIIFDPTLNRENQFGDAGTINSNAFRKHDTGQSPSPSLLSVSTEHASDPAL